MNRLWQAIAISRPILWPSTFLGFLIGFFLGNGQITFSALLFSLGLTFPYSLWLCSVNDYVDFESDQENKLRKTITWARTDKNFLKRLIFLSLVFMIGYVFLLPNLITFFLGLAALILPFLYSFPPVQLKIRPFLDTITNGLTAVIIILIGYFFSGVKPINQATLQIITGVFLGVSGMHILGTLRDYTTDRTSKVATIAVFLGQKAAAFLGMVVFLCLFLTTKNLPVEFSLCAAYGVTIFAILSVKPGEKLTQRLGIVLLLGFFIASAISLITNSWEKSL
jgi:4-hydroxybenzoate polyprenyltransferase